MRSMETRICAKCGTAFEIAASDARRGRGVYCSLGCSVSKFVADNQKHRLLKAGDKFHMLTLIKPIAKGRHPTWFVRCDCGVEKITRASRFFGSRPILSCGCYRVPRPVNPNALNQNPLYRTYHSMISRCGNKNDHLYGGKGIKVCDRWKFGDGVVSGFTAFLIDMGPKPTKAHSIDRIDSNGDYSPENCRWATPKEQSRNTSKNIRVEVNGQSLCLLDAIQHLNAVVSYDCVLSRLEKGWPLEHAVSLPKLSGVPLRHRLAPPIDKKSRHRWLANESVQRDYRSRKSP